MWLVQMEMLWRCKVAETRFKRMGREVTSCGEFS